MALIKSIRVKTISFAEIREQASKVNGNCGYIPKIVTEDDGTNLKGIIVGFKARVRTVEGFAESNYLFVSREETFKVTTNCGREVECTGNHKLLLDQEKDIWCETRDLKPGDFIRLENGYAEIKSIISTGIKAVADICIPGPHSYLVDNGIVSHNSLVANQLAINFATQGLKVVIVPLEMSKPEMTARIIANKSGFDVTRILQHKLATNERDIAYSKYERWVKKVKSKGGRLTIFKPEEDMSIEEVFASLSSYDADVVIIDYISLLKGADADDAWQKLGAMARIGKINAESTHRANILLCQVNDEGKIRYARAISEHSTNSWIWVTKKEEREREIGRIRIEQPKARNSRSYPFEVGFHWSTMKVVDVDSSESIGEVTEPMKNLTDI